MAVTIGTRLMALLTPPSAFLQTLVVLPPSRICRTTFMCQLDWANDAQRAGKRWLLGVSVGVSLEEVSI